MFAIEWGNNPPPRKEKIYEYMGNKYFVQEIDESFVFQISMSLSLQEVGFLNINSICYLFFPLIGGNPYSELCNQKRSFKEKVYLAKVLLFQLMKIKKEHLLYYLDKNTIYFDTQFSFLVGINTTRYEKNEERRSMYLVTSLVLDLLENTNEFRTKHLHPNIYRFLTKQENLTYTSLQEIWEDVVAFEEVVQEKGRFEKWKSLLKVAGKICLHISILLSLITLLIPIFYYFTTTKEGITSIGDVLLK